MWKAILTIFSLEIRRKWSFFWGSEGFFNAFFEAGRTYGPKTSRTIAALISIKPVIASTVTTCRVAWMKFGQFGWKSKSSEKDLFFFFGYTFHEHRYLIWFHTNSSGKVQILYGIYQNIPNIVKTSSWTHDVPAFGPCGPLGAFGAFRGHSKQLWSEEKQSWCLRPVWIDLW